MGDKEAIIIGATGLVGRLLTQRLLEDERYGRVSVFSRRPLGVFHDKLTEHMVDFEDIASWRDRLGGDVLFSTFGTTMGQAKVGTRSALDAQAAFAHIDHDIPLEIARQAKAQGVPRVVLLSSIGASERALFVYLALKGKLDAAVSALGFEHSVILRPSALVGLRESPRPGEKLGIASLGALSRIGLGNLRPIEARVVAQAMAELGVVPLDAPRRVYKSKEISSFVAALGAS
jgi:uncharacterized protein YbjT (DUF2867 family)